MSRKRQLSSALNPKQNEEPEVVEQEEETQEQVNESQNEPPSEVLEEVEENDMVTVKDISERLKNKYQEKSKKPTVEDTHTRSTFLFRNDLQKRLDKLAKNKRGFKTMFINEAIEALLNEYEN